MAKNVNDKKGKKEKNSTDSRYDYCKFRIKKLRMSKH